MVKADCQASAKAEASFAAECTPPSIALDYQLSAEFQAMAAADVSVQAALSAKIEAFGRGYAKLLANGARINGILTASADLPEAGIDAVGGVVDDLALHGNIQAKFQAACAVTALGAVPGIITAAVDDLNASLTAIGTVSASVN
jgi:hypothetical protein